MELGGMGLLLKSLGVDPEEIRGNVDNFMAGMRLIAQKMEANQTRLETKLDLVLAKLDGLDTPVRSTREFLGIAETSEKFPEQVIQAANSGPLPDIPNASQTTGPRPNGAMKEE